MKFTTELLTFPKVQAKIMSKISLKIIARPATACSITSVKKNDPNNYNILLHKQFFLLNSRECQVLLRIINVRINYPFQVRKAKQD